MNRRSFFGRLLALVGIGATATQVEAEPFDAEKFADKLRKLPPVVKVPLELDVDGEFIKKFIKKFEARYRG